MPHALASPFAEARQISQVNNQLELMEARGRVGGANFQKRKAEVPKQALGDDFDHCLHDADRLKP